MMTREATNKILELVDEGIVDTREMLMNTLFYMSEHDVSEMFSMYSAEYGLELDEEDDDE